MKIPFSDTEEKKLVLDLAGSDCRLGELVTLNWNDALIKKSGQTSYAYCAVSNYVCVREATDSQCGILVKVLGRISKEFIMFVNGEPFCVRRNVENSFRACSPRLLRSTRKSMRLAGV